MSNRAVVGLALGVSSGTAIAGVSSLFDVLRSPPEAPVVAYAGAALAGILTSLVAGKPVWKNSASESAVKAAAGAFLAVASLYGIRKWLPGVTLDLGTRFGAGPLGAVPLGHLPLIAVAIALVFQIDDAFGADPTIAPASEEAAAGRGSIASSSPSDATATGTDAVRRDG